MRILVIDDEIDVAALLAEAVRAEGHEVVVAHDGKEGLALLGHLRPQGVFLDVRMPEFGGIAVLRQIRAADARLPVVLITGRAQVEEIEEARRLGVTGIIEKPLLLDRLTEALTALENAQ